MTDESATTERPFSQADLLKNEFNQYMERLFGEIQQQNQTDYAPIIRVPARLIEPDGTEIELKSESKLFQTSADRKIFEENGVPRTIFNDLFQNQSPRQFLIELTKYNSHISISIGDVDRLQPSLSCGATNEDVKSPPFWMFLDNVPGRFPWSKRTDKKINATPADCLAIAKTVEALARQQGLIKQ